MSDASSSSTRSEDTNVFLAQHDDGTSSAVSEGMDHILASAPLHDDDTSSSSSSQEEIQNNWTFFHACYGYRDFDVLDMIKKGANVNENSRAHQCTPLIGAAKNGEARICKLLIDHGAQVNQRNLYDEDGATAIYYAYKTMRGNGYLALRILLQRGANVYYKDRHGRTLLDIARDKRATMVRLLEEIVDNQRVVYVPSNEMTNFEVTFVDHPENLIILTDDFEGKYEGRPTITIQRIQECIHSIPNLVIPKKDQVRTLQNALRQASPTIYEHAQQSRLSLLHLLSYVPSEYYTDRELSIILDKCPEAGKATDCDGKTPIHHAILRKRRQDAMSQESYNVLLARSPQIVLHKAIQATPTMKWLDLRVLVQAKPDALTAVDEDNGLFPFMLAATKCKKDHPNRFLGSLGIVYRLLRMNPGVIEGLAN